MLVNFIIGFTIGYFTTQYGISKQWSAWKSLSLSLIFSTIASLLMAAISHADTSAEIALRRTAVMINEYKCNGSGSFVEGKSGKKYILTNAHVCNCARYQNTISATLEGGKLTRGTIVRQSWEFDLCAAEVSDPVPTLKLARSFPYGSEITTRGYPGSRLTESHGRAREDIMWVTRFGIDEIGKCPIGSDPEYDMGDILVGCNLKFISTLTSLFSRPGSSGSPVVDDQGNLVGVVSSWLQGRPYDAGMVPYVQVKSFLNHL